MSKLLIALFVAAGLGVSGLAAAHSAKVGVSSPSQSKDGRALAMKHADAQYKMDKLACSQLSGNARDICITEAAGTDAVARADAGAAFENTPKARERARVVRAQADYDTGIEKCHGLADNRKDVCVKEAKAALVMGKANARVDCVDNAIGQVVTRHQ